MNKSCYILPVIIVLILAVSTMGEEEPKGAAEMVLFGGDKGDTSFPHHKHQEVLGDCKKCHNLFPKVKGAIEDMKKQGKLKIKEAMNQCRDCHKQFKKEGRETGPVSCKKCHDLPKQEVSVWISINA